MKALHSHSDSLMDLLAAQCADLEALLLLARRESVAARMGSFEDLLTITQARLGLGEQLEEHHRQIMSLRETFAGPQRSRAADELTERTRQLAVEIQAHDAGTTALLVTSRARLGQEISALEKNQQNSMAYLQYARANGLNVEIDY
jgi:flagellar biosynthesis/type III secretory pathway chaperone